MGKSVAALVAALLLVAGCSTAPRTNGIVVRGIPVTIVTHYGERSWAAGGSTVYLSIARERSHEAWAELITHELCHVLDQAHGRPSNAFPGDPSGEWGERPSERWAETCSYRWLRREGGLEFVTPFPGVGIDPRNAPLIASVTISEYERLCREQPTKRVCR